MDETPVQASTVLNEPFKLAHNGYKLQVTDAELDHKLGNVRLLEGATVHADWPAMFTWHGDKFLVEADADSAIIETMLEYLNCGGEPARLAQIAEAVASLPQITVPGYTLVGVVADVTWTSFYTHMDGKCYEIVHGLAAEELTDESVDARLEEGDDDEP